MAIHTKTNICSLFWAIQRPKKWGAESPGYPVALLPKNCPRPTRVGRESVCDPPSPQKSRPRRRVVCPFCVTSAAAASFSSPSVTVVPPWQQRQGAKKETSFVPSLDRPEFFSRLCRGLASPLLGRACTKEQTRSHQATTTVLQKNQKDSKFPFCRGEKGKKICFLLRPHSSSAKTLHPYPTGQLRKRKIWPPTLSSPALPPRPPQTAPATTTCTLTEK